MVVSSSCTTAVNYMEEPNKLYFLQRLGDSTVGGQKVLYTEHQLRNVPVLTLKPSVFN